MRMAGIRPRRQAGNRFARGVAERHVTVDRTRRRYHFRRLTCREEFGIKFPRSEDERKTILADALTDISGLPEGTCRAGH